LIPSQFNSSNVEQYFLPYQREFPYVEQIDEISYLRRFRMGVYRVFHSHEEFATFRRYRQGRESPYDGLLYNQQRADLKVGCLVKGLMVAESRGDPYISHLKVSSSGCIGMFGFCDGTADHFQEFTTVIK